MADVTVFAPPPIVVEVVQGSPPVDQSAEVAALTQQVADLTAERDALATDKANLTHELETANAKLANGLTQATETVAALT